MDRASLKLQAKAAIKGKIGILFLVTVIVAAVGGIASAVLSLIPVVGSVAAMIIVTPALGLSLVRIYMDVAKGGTPEIKDAFSGFDDFWAAFKVTFFVGLFTFLWSLLLYIPGIIKGISYSMSMYILAENKGKPALECIEESKKMTEGHKMELFILALSFIGCGLLCGITFGIAAIWVMPYMQTTMVNVYNSLKPAAEVVEEAPTAIEE